MVTKASGACHCHQLQWELEVLLRPLSKILKKVGLRCDGISWTPSLMVDWLIQWLETTQVSRQVLLDWISFVFLWLLPYILYLWRGILPNSTTPWPPPNDFGYTNLGYKKFWCGHNMQNHVTTKPSSSFSPSIFMLIICWRSRLKPKHTMTVWSA